jgi:hypothetical protein
MSSATVIPRNIPARRRIDQREVDAAPKIADIGRMKKSVTISLEAETLAAAIARAAAVGLTLDAWVESLIVQRMRAATPLHIVESNAEAIAAMKEALGSSTTGSRVLAWTIQHTARIRCGERRPRRFTKRQEISGRSRDMRLLMDPA